MRFEWDLRKAVINLQKHKVSFEEATTALQDPLSVTAFDPDHSVDENRFITFDISSRGRFLVVSHGEESEVIRIISARLVSKNERRIYEEG